MAHDETESSSKWAKYEHPIGGQQQLKKNLLQVKRKLPPLSADSSPEQHFLGVRVGVSPRPIHPGSKETRNPPKLLTRGSTFIHDVS